MTKNEECESLDSSEKDPVSSIIKNMETIKVLRGHSIITLSQNDQNLDPSPPSNVPNFTLTPRPISPLRTKNSTFSDF